MAEATPAKGVDVSTLLTQLDNLEPDEYFIAFGPAGRQFCATPNGYSAVELPPKVVDDLLAGQVKKVTWATFGDHPSSYFFGYLMKDGNRGHRAGNAIPSTLRPHLDSRGALFRLTSGNLASMAELRVKLGVNRSWVVWTGSVWACRRVPSGLMHTLCQLSSEVQEDGNEASGKLKKGPLTDVTWHGNGSFYFKSGGEHSWNFQSDALKQGWNDLWAGIQHVASTEPTTDLAYVAIDPHSATGETLAFIMKKQPGREPDFAMRFEPDETLLRLPAPREEPVEAAPGLMEATQPEAPRGDDAGRSDIPQLYRFEDGWAEPKTYRWAVSNQTGRSHPTDAWELKLKKGERIKVLEDGGNNWFIAMRGDGKNGYVHATWLDFQDLRPHADPREAYARWTADTEKWLHSRAVRDFLSPSSYMNVCMKEPCKPIKQEGVDICVHDLHELLRGSGQYSLDFLRTQRNRYHPDKFARSCHPDNREELKVKAEGLFVLFGVLMDMLENAP